MPAPLTLGEIAARLGGRVAGNPQTVIRQVGSLEKRHFVGLPIPAAADVIASGFVLFGLTLAAKPADADHPYGHGRFEILTGLLIGLVLVGGGGLISYTSLSQLGHPRMPMAAGMSTSPGMSSSPG